jgi:transposase
MPGKVMRSPLEPLKNVARTLCAYRSLLLNPFPTRKQYSSGVVEGLNNKVKLTLNRAYGFRTPMPAKVALFHALEKLSEPQFTHSRNRSGIGRIRIDTDTALAA